MNSVASYRHRALVRRAIALAGLCAALHVHAAEPAYVPAVDEAPPVHIPSPAERSRLQKQPEHDGPGRNFPANALAVYLQRFEQELDDLSRSEDDLEAVVLQRLRDDLDLTLQPGWYRFDRDCPLLYDPEAQGEDVPYVSLEVSCLPENYRPDFLLRLHRTNAVNGQPAEKKAEPQEERRLVENFARYELLRGLREPRQFTGELYLERVLLREGFRTYWRWLPGYVSYANVMLESLRSKYRTSPRRSCCMPTRCAATRRRCCAGSRQNWSARPAPNARYPSKISPPFFRREAISNSDAVVRCAWPRPWSASLPRNSNACDWCSRAWKIKRQSGWNRTLKSCCRRVPRPPENWPPIGPGNAFWPGCAFGKS